MPTLDLSTCHGENNFHHVQPYLCWLACWHCCCCQSTVEWDGTPTRLRKVLQGKALSRVWLKGMSSTRGLGFSMDGPVFVFGDNTSQWGLLSLVFSINGLALVTRSVSHWVFLFLSMVWPNISIFCNLRVSNCHNGEPAWCSFLSHDWLKNNPANIQTKSLLPVCDICSRMKP